MDLGDLVMRGQLPPVIRVWFVATLDWDSQRNCSQSVRDGFRHWSKAYNASFVTITPSRLCKHTSTNDYYYYHPCRPVPRSNTRMLHSSHLSCLAHVRGPFVRELGKTA